MNTKANAKPIVTISVLNLKPGDVFVEKVGGPCPKTNEYQVLNVYRKDTDRIEMAFTCQDRYGIREVTFRLYHKIQVRRTSTLTDFTVDWGMPKNLLRQYVSLLSKKKKAA